MIRSKKNSCPKGYVMKRGVCSPVNNKYNAISSNNTGGNTVMDWGSDCCATGCSDFYARVTCGTQVVTCQIPQGCWADVPDNNLFPWDESWQGTTANFYSYGEEMLIPDYHFEGVDAGPMPYALSCYNGCSYSGGSLTSACLGTAPGWGSYANFQGANCGSIVKCDCKCPLDCGATFDPGGHSADWQPGEWRRGGKIKRRR